MPLRHGGQILIDQLRIQGCQRVYCVPGESYLAALDGLHGQEAIKTIICRQEGGAAIMAEADGKMTGRPGVCFVTRGPGATNASAGVHVAQQDSTPMILFIGQVARDMRDREAFQEVDFRQMFAPLAKWVAEIDDTARIPEYVSRAYHCATSGRPGPVVLSLPEDMLSAEVEVADAKPAVPVEAKAAAEDLGALSILLKKAERPLVILGGGGWSPVACDAMTRAAEHLDLPVSVSFRCQDYIDNRHPNYVGAVGLGINPKLLQRLRDCDLLLVIGSRIGEITSQGFTLLDIPNPKQTLVHVYPGSDELGRIYRPDLAINASVGSFAARLAALEGVDGGRWGDWRRVARSDFEAQIVPAETPGAVKLEQVMATLRETLPRDAIVTNGAGNYAGFVNRYYLYGPYRSQLAPTSGSMGYGVPAAVAAQLAAPGRQVVAFAGDGCFLMTGQELATAVQYDLPIVFIVVNNGSYGTIRMHQERHYPGRVSGTELHNPDFAALAEAYGALGMKVEHGEDFAAVLETALASKRTALIEVKTDPEAISPTATLSAIRAQAQAKK